MKAALAIPEPIIVPAERGFARLALLVVTFGALWFVLCRQLSGEWSVNEQYTYGWFVPFFCAYLFWLRWEDRPEPEGILIFALAHHARRPYYWQRRARARKRKR